MNYKKILYFFFLLLGLLPIINLLNVPRDTMLLIFSIFVFVYVFRATLVFPFLEKRWKRYSLIIISIIASGLIAEVLAWTSEYLAKSPAPALLHPQLLPDLIMSIGFYGSWALVWVILLNKFRFSIKEVFIVQGLYGVLIEQQGAIFMQGLATFPVGVLLWVYVFVVYGSIIGIPYILTSKNIQTQDLPNPWYKYVVAVILLFVSTISVLVLWGFMTGWFLPEPKPIWLYPLW